MSKYEASHRFSILIPHFRTGKMTAYTIAQILACTPKEEIDIIVIDNNAGDGSIEYLAPFREHIRIVEYPTYKLQSHGVAFDYVLPSIKTEYFITLESDAFPICEGWLDNYREIIDAGYDCIGSELQLSGGRYLHPCGAVYRKSVWEEANEFCRNTPYLYFPNMSLKRNFPCHLMVHISIISEFIRNPEDYIELADSYKPYTQDLAEKKVNDYLPTVGPFHNGMGGNEESYYTYGQRTVETEAPTILLEGAKKIINRLGYEPGQFFHAYQIATGRKIFHVSTQVEWLPGKENQQQEFTYMSTGVKHLWGISAYHGLEGGDPAIAKIKQSLPEELYNSLPAHQKI